MPICGKIFERIIFNPIFEYLEKNSLLCPNQSGFCPFDSCENQLLSIVHDIYANFDQHPTLEVRGNFFDILKAFDKVWHEGLLFKLEQIGIAGNLSLLKSFLSNKFQQVVLNGQCSSWSSVLGGVLQGSILGPLLFLIYINDLPENLQSTVKLFADDTSLFLTVYDPNISAIQLESDLKKISCWVYKWKMTFYPDHCKQAQEVIFSWKTVKASHPSIIFNTVPVARTTCQKHLGLYLDEKLSFYDHINAKISKANKGIGIIKRLSNTLPRNSLLTTYKSFIRPHLDYCDIIYGQPNNESFYTKIECIQYNAALATTGAIKGRSQSKLYKELGLGSFKFRRWSR